MRRLGAKLSANEREFSYYSYATKKNMWAATVTICGAWLSGLIIAGPAHIQSPPFR
jgi:hypothetical protein